METLHHKKWDKEQPAERTARHIMEHVRSPEARDTILARHASRIQRKLNKYLYPDQEASEALQAESIDEDTFGDAFDPALPTLAIDVSHTMREIELIAIEAQRRRERGEPSCNIIGFSSATDCGRIAITQDGGVLQVSHGFLFGADGQVFHGALPRPTSVAMVETGNLALLRQCEEMGVSTLTSSSDIAVLDNKHLIPHIAPTVGLTPTKRLPVEVLSHAQERQVIIKPANSSSSRGVRIFSLPSEDAQAVIHYNLLDIHRYEPLIEERVRSFPLHQPETGQRLEWRARIFVSEGRPTGMYACFTSKDEIVRAGSSLLLLSQLERYSDTKTAIAIRSKLEEAGWALASVLPQGVGGGDVIIDERMNQVLLEVNVGQVGGLSAVESQDSDEQSLDHLGKFIDSWLPRLAENVKGVTEVSSSTIPLQSNTVGLFRGLYDLKKLDLLAALPKEEMQLLSDTHFEWYLWCYARLHCGEPVESVIDDFIQLAPLEFATHAAKIAQITGKSAALSEYLTVLSELLPEEYRVKAGEEILLQQLRRGFEIDDILSYNQKTV